MYMKYKGIYTLIFESIRKVRRVCICIWNINVYIYIHWFSKVYKKLDGYVYVRISSNFSYTFEMNYLWSIYGHLWSIYGNLWCIYGHLWFVYGHLWSIYGHLWSIYIIYGPYMVIYGSYMVIYGPYMVIYGPYMVHIWSLMVHICLTKRSPKPPEALKMEVFFDGSSFIDFWRMSLTKH